MHIGIPSLCGLMVRADISIGAGGTASWERTCVGLPCIVLQAARNQRQVMNLLTVAGVARCLDSKDKEEAVRFIQKQLLELQNDTESLTLMSQSCSEIGDGRGLARIASAIQGPKNEVNLRSARGSDMWLYYWWANEKEVRQKSFSTKMLTMESHRNWFYRNLESSKTLMCILEDYEELPIGQIRFEREETYRSRAKVSFSLDHMARGRGLGQKLLKMGLIELQRRWGEGIEVYGEVIENNKASCRAFIKTGFNEVGSLKDDVRSFKQMTVEIKRSY